ncbi:MAG TPA: DinB family protein [Candidatus Limnocylindria bacterium]|nr:DinB family protein [Candidatus Limnocylindria bacterium]
MSPAPKRALAEMRDRLVREVDRVIGATDGMDAAQVAWTPAAKGANSLLVLAAHTVGAAERHILVSIAGRKPGGTRDEEFAAKADIARVRARWDAVKRGIVEVLDSLPPGRLDDDLPGPVAVRSVQAMIVHAIAHAAEHAGQAELTRDLVKERDAAR